MSGPAQRKRVAEIDKLVEDALDRGAINVDEAAALHCRYIKANGAVAMSADRLARMLEPLFEARCNREPST